MSETALQTSQYITNLILCQLEVFRDDYLNNKKYLISITNLYIENQTILSPASGDNIHYTTDHITSHQTKIYFETETILCPTIELS